MYQDTRIALDNGPVVLQNLAMTTPTSLETINMLSPSMQDRLRSDLIRTIRQSAHGISETLDPVDMQDWTWDELVAVGQPLVDLGDTIREILTNHA